MTWEDALMDLYAQLPDGGDVTALELRCLSDQAGEEALALLDEHGVASGAFQNTGTVLQGKRVEVLRFIVQGESA